MSCVRACLLRVGIRLIVVTVADVLVGLLESRIRHQLLCTETLAQVEVHVDPLDAVGGELLCRIVQ